MQIENVWPTFSNFVVLSWKNRLKSITIGFPVNISLNIFILVSQEHLIYGRKYSVIILALL